MASSSKEYEDTNKRVVVVKSTDFFPLKKINLKKHKAILDDLKTNLSQNVSYISKIHDQATGSSSDSFVYAQAATDSKSSQSSANVGAVPKKKYINAVPVEQGGPEKTKLISFGNLSKVSKVANGTGVEQTTEDATGTAEDLNAEVVMNLVNMKFGDFLETQIPFFQQNKSPKNEHSGISLDIENHQDTLPETNSLHDTPPKLPSDILRYRVREEHYAEELDSKQNIKEDIEETKEHLESILILDSPENNYKLFTREELKKLPDKIFESPPRPLVKQEVVMPEEENLKEPHQNLDIGSQFQNLKIKALESEPLINDATEIEFKDGGRKVQNPINQEGKRMKKMWEIELKDENFVHSADLNAHSNQKFYIERYTKHTVELKKDMKDISIADEDVVIFNEMDKLIEEIKVENKNLTCITSKDEPSLKSVGKVKDLNCTSCVDKIEEHVGIRETLNKTLAKNEREAHKSDDNSVTKTEERKHCGEIKEAIECKTLNEDAKVEKPKGDILNEKEKYDSSSHTSVENVTKIAENILSPPHVDGKKRDILEQLVLNTEIDKFQINETEGDSDISSKQEKPSKLPNITTVNISEKNELEISTMWKETVAVDDVTKSYTTVENNFKEISPPDVSQSTKCTERINVAKHFSEFLQNTTGSEILTKDRPEATESINVNYDQPQQYVDVTTIPQNAYQEINLSECSILIVREDGSLQPISLDSNIDPCTLLEKKQLGVHFNQTQIKGDGTEQSTVNNEQKKKISSEDINKEEILATLERAKVVQCKLTDNFGDRTAIEKEKLKLFSGSLKEHTKIFKELYEKLEVITELTEEELEGNLKAEAISKLQDNLNFVKDIVGKCFIKEEKNKPKYKVIKISKKNDITTKKNSEGTAIEKMVTKKKAAIFPRKSTDKLLQKTLYRMNKLLNVIEQNNKLVIKNRRSTFVNTLKQMAKRDLKTIKAAEKTETSSGKETNVNFGLSQSKKWDSQILENDHLNEELASTSENSENSSDEPDINEKSLTIVLDRSGRPEDVNQKGGKRAISKRKPLITSSTPKVINCGTGTIGRETNSEERNDNGEENQPIAECKEKTQDFEIKREVSPRYSLRSRKSRSINPAYDCPTQFCKEGSACKKEKCPGYEVSYLNVTPLKKNGNRVFDYVLENDEKPCVVLYHKKQERSKPSFANTPRSSRKQCFTENLKGDDSKVWHVARRYETRSRAMARRRLVGDKVLRNRKF